MVILIEKLITYLIITKLYSSKRNCTMKITESSQQPSLNNFLKDNSATLKKGWTNNVFRIDKGDNIIYLLPAYLRLKVKNIVGIDLFTLTGEINCTFILSINYGQMQPQAVQFLSNSVEISFHKSDALRLDSTNLEVIRKNNQKKKLLTFTLRKSIATRLHGEIFWSPFETVKFIISLTLRTLRTQINDKHFKFKFNLMDCDDMDTKFSLSQENIFGCFKVAQKQLDVQYTNRFSYLFDKSSRNMRKINIQSMKQFLIEESIKKISKEKLILEQELEPITINRKLNNFNFAHFVLTVYKKPNVAILTIFFPLLLLGIINIAIFYQNNKQTGKMMLNISALLVSFIALIPTVRQNTAISPTVTFTQILVFIESSTTILTLIHLVEYRNEDGFVTDVNTDGLMIACIIITALVAGCIVVMILLHKFYWKRKYHGKRRKVSKDLNFNHQTWYNRQCDIYYERIFSGMEEHILALKQTKQSVMRKIQSINVQ